MKIFRLTFLVMMFSVTSYAEENGSNLSLEDLMNIEVTSVSKHEEKAFPAASAIYALLKKK